MSQQLSLDFLDMAQPVPISDPGEVRSESRTQIVRIVEYTPYPRRTRDERRRVAFTRDTSASGMCIAVETPEEPGTLLRVVGTNVDGDASSDTLARVAWCAPRSEGRGSESVVFCDR